MRRNWIKLYVDQVLRGTCFEELIPDERFIWFGFLLLAGDNAMEGKICVTEEMGFSNSQLASLLKCDAELIKRSIKKMVKYEKIKVYENNIIQIINWKKYQSEYQRKKEAKQRLTDIISDEMSDEMSFIDRERDREEEREEERDKDKEKNKYLDFVFLTDKEHKKLLDKLGKNRTDDMIERLNNYIGSHGKKYISHYFTILTWDRKDPDKKTIVKTKFFKAEEDEGEFVPMPDHFKKIFKKDLKKIEDKKRVFDG